MTKTLALRIVVHDYAGHPFQVDLSRELARRGHSVWHVYFAGDKGPKGALERMPCDPNSFQVLPTGIKRDYSKSNFLTRRNNDALYGRAVAAKINALKPDVVISGNTPLDAQGAIIDATHRADGVFVNWIQDFYSLAIERLVAHKWLGLGALVSIWYRRLGRRQLSQSDGAVLISDDFRGSLTGFEARPDCVAVIPNWGAIGGIPLRPKSNPWARRHGLSERFIFLYSGTLGLKHNPEALVALADAFANRPDVSIVVAATGLGRDRLDAILTAQPRANVLMLPIQSFDDFPDVLGAADVLVALLEQDAGEFSAPSKVLSYLCAGRPVLLAAPPANIASRMIADIDAGFVVPPNDAQAFIAAADRLYEDQASRTRMGDAGRTYAEEHFVIDRVADRFEAVFGAVSDARGRPAAMPILAFIHLPPPLHGVSVVSQAVIDWITRFNPVKIVDLSYDGLRMTSSNLAAYLRPMIAVFGQLLSRRTRRRQWCYLASSSGPRQLFDLLVIAMAKSRGLRVIIHHHSMAYVARRSVLMNAVCRLLSADDAMIFLGEHHRAAFTSVYAQRARSVAISNAALVPLQKRPLRANPQGPIRIGFLANLELSKGLDTFLEVARTLAAGGTSVSAVVAGPYRDDACRALMTRAIDDGLGIYLGPVSGAAKQSFFDEIDIFVFPSRYRNETEPVVVLEAMAQGVPVIASAVGCLPEVLPVGFALALSGELVTDAKVMASAALGVIAQYEIASLAMLEAIERRRASSIDAQTALRILLEAA